MNNRGTFILYLEVQDVTLTFIPCSLNLWIKIKSSVFIRVKGYGEGEDKVGY